MRAWAAGTLLLVCFLPSAAAEAYVHGRLAPVSHSVTFAPGGRATVDYAWTVDFENTTCTQGADVGVDFVVEDGPTWAGASFQPMGDVATPPEASGTTQLEIVLDDEGPRPASGTIRIGLGLNVYNPGACTPTPRPLAEGANVTIDVAPGSEATPTATNGDRANGTPAPSVALALVAVAAALSRRR